jgi:Eukaryotic aspartyl protease
MSQHAHHSSVHSSFDVHMLPSEQYLLDDSHPDGLPSLHIGGVLEQFRSSIQWSEPRTVLGDPTLSPDYVFNMHAPRVCNIDLLQSGQMYVKTIIDSGSACLSLPAHMFDALMRIVPAECSDIYSCNLPSGLQAAMPTLSFSMEQNGNHLFVDLSKLFVVNTLPRFCILRDATPGAPIIFGTSVLRTFYVALSATTGQVGLANAATTEESTLQCRKPLACIGMQRRDDFLNVCVDPDCSDFLLMTLDETTKQCSLVCVWLSGCLAVWMSGCRVSVAVVAVVFEIYIFSVCSHLVCVCTRVCVYICVCICVCACVCPPSCCPLP